MSVHHGTAALAYRCSTCRSTVPLAPVRWRCDCGGVLDLPPGGGLGRGDIDSRVHSLWRYRAALRAGRHAVTLGEGWTPLVEAEWDGRPVHAKLDFLSPSGSFKDRGSSLLISHLVDAGVESLGDDSSGNAGASIATYAAAAGLTCRIYVPASTSQAKVVQIAAVGASVVRIPGSRQDVADAIVRDAGEFFYAGHNWQPFFLEGLKTLGYELWEALGFRAPDAVVLPIGGGSSLIGCALAFGELVARREIAGRPRLYGVQAAHCAPLHYAYEHGEHDVVPVSVAPTIAEGISVSRPVRARGVLDAIRQSGGDTVAVSEEEIVAALAELARRGFFVEPTSAAAAAGLSRLIAQGTIAKGDTTVLFLTGSGLKAAATVGSALGLTT